MRKLEQFSKYALESVAFGMCVQEAWSPKMFNEWCKNPGNYYFFEGEVYCGSHLQFYLFLDDQDGKEDEINAWLESMEIAKACHACNNNNKRGML